MDPLPDKIPAFRLNDVENIPANGGTGRIRIKQVEKSPVRVPDFSVTVHEHCIR